MPRLSPDRTTRSRASWPALLRHFAGTSDTTNTTNTADTTTGSGRGRDGRGTGAGACWQRRDWPDGAELLALGENAVFAAGDLVVKVGRDATRRSSSTGRGGSWPSPSGSPSAGVPAVRAAEPEARSVDGHPVTVWHRLPDAVRPAEPADLAVTAAAGPCTALPRLPPAAPRAARRRRALAAARGRRDRPGRRGVSARTAGRVRGRRRRARPAAAAWARSTATRCRATSMSARDGPVLVDLETFSADLREHDLVVMALSRDRYGLPAEAYDAFTAAYGWDVTRVGGLRRAARRPRDGELRLGRPARPDATRRPWRSSRRRVASLRDDDPRCAGTPSERRPPARSTVMLPRTHGTHGFGRSVDGLFPITYSHAPLLRLIAPSRSSLGRSSRPARLVGEA